jgi:YVTN family beta-propeller protein
MRRFRLVLVFELSGALVGVVPNNVGAARGRCRAIVLVANANSGTVSTIDLKTRTKDPTDITVGSAPSGVAVTPDGKTAFVTNTFSGTVSTIDVKTRPRTPPTSPSAHNPAGWRSRRVAGER